MKRNGERECVSFRQSGAASALGPVWVQSLIKKPCTFTQCHKTAGRDEREGPSTRYTVTLTQQLSERWEEIENATRRRGQTVDGNERRSEEDVLVSGMNRLINDEFIGYVRR